MARVDAERYMRDEIGRQLPQTSAQDMIAAVVRLLDVQPGARVLELGTGSGYSTALLACLVGSDGRVVSIDVDSGLVERAARLLRADAFRQVLVQHGDGRLGWESAALYDRVVAWATTEELPVAWAEQLTLSGVVVAPVQLLPLAHAVAVARLRVLQRSALMGESLISGSFVPMTDAPLRDWSQPPALADLITSNGWLSARWLRRTNIQDDACNLVQHLLPGPTPLNGDESAQAFRAYLMAEAPGGLTTAQVPKLGLAFGCGQPGSLALLASRGRAFAESGDSRAGVVLRSWRDAWRARGRPGFERLAPMPERTSRGWRIRAILRPE
jgi:protein-L-isoaspartate(D-aspartate) O-methyltransferase